MKNIKQISLVACVLAVNGLAGCSSLSKLPGSTPAAIGAIGLQKSFAASTTTTLAADDAPALTGSISPATGDAPATTGSIVPSDEESQAITYPEMEGEMKAPPEASGRENADTSEVDEEELSAQERHRRELVNRGDLKEGEPLPAE